MIPSGRPAFPAAPFPSAVLFLLAALAVPPSAAAQDQTAPAAAQVRTAPEDKAAGRALLRERLYAEYLLESGRSGPGFLKTQRADGSWSDIDYADQSRTVWKPAVHVSRLAAMAGAYRTPTGPGYGSRAMKAGVEKGLEYWFRRGLKADNWWFNLIGTPQQLCRVLVLLGDELPPEPRARILSVLPDPAHAPKAVTTGENLVWIASSQLVRGLVGGDDADLAAAAQAIGSEIRIGETEGIQADASFHQHGSQLYNGGYGMGFMDDAASWAALLAGTPWAFSPERVDVLTYYLLQGQRRMSRGVWFDASARGREPARPKNGATAPRLVQSATVLAALNPAAAGELRDFAAKLGAAKKLAERPREEGAPPPPAYWTGSAPFWRSDFLSHSRPGFYASVKMVSSRTVGTELVNGENLKGFWLPFGSTHIARWGDEYADLWAVWDFGRVPGVTSPHREDKPGPKFSQAEDFVGSVSDGTLGLAALRMDKAGTKARKAWFLFDEGFLALGCAIESGASEETDTTLNQCALKGPVLSDAGPVPGPGTQAAERVLDGARWVLHDGIAYLPAPGSALRLKTGPASGSWKSVDSDYSADPVVRDLFCLWISHGTKPAGAAYSYTVLPGADAAAAAAWAAAPPVVVLANTPALQAVRDKRGGDLAAVFSEPGRLDLGGGAVLSCDRAVLLLVRGPAGAETVWAADPRQGAGTVAVRIETAGGSRTARIELPAAPGLRGSSASASLR